MPCALAGCPSHGPKETAGLNDQPRKLRIKAVTGCSQLLFGKSSVHTHINPPSEITIATSIAHQHLYNRATSIVWVLFE